MPKKKPNPNRKTLQLAREPILPGQTRKPSIRLPRKTQDTMLTLQTLIDGTLGCTPAMSLIVTVGLQLYMEKMITLLDDLNAAGNKKRTSTTELIHLQERMEHMREQLFSAAGRSSSYWNTDLGRLPRLDDLIGKDFNQRKVAIETFQKLKELAQRISIASTQGGKKGEYN